jgi:hypothetical protein
MQTSARVSSSLVPALVTGFTLAVGAAIVYVAGTAGLVIFAWSAPFAIWFLWAARNVETLEQRYPRRIELRLPARTDAGLVPVRASGSLAAMNEVDVARIVAARRRTA